MNGWYDVRDYDAKGDGQQPDHVAIQAAINAAAANGGGVVWLPPGTYLLQAGITVTEQVQIVGAGWPAHWVEGQRNPGTWIRVEDEGFSAFTVKASGATIRDVAFVYDQERSNPLRNGWEPRNFQHAIHVWGTDVTLDGIHLYNATRGILVNHPSGVIGRVSLNRIWGQPLQEGIYIDNAHDVIKVNNVHLWPFWTDALGDKRKTEGLYAREYQKQHGVAIRSGRNDNPHFSNIFALGYGHGFLFQYRNGGKDDSGPTSKFMIVNADLDFCGKAIEVNGLDTTGQIVNLNAQGDKEDIVGIALTALSARVQATNIRLTHFPTNAIRVNNHCVIHLSNIWIQDWNFTQKEHRFPGIEVVDAHSQVILGRPFYFEQGEGILKAPDTGGNGKIVN
ncbi:glycosyl hydrolase family 28-related protein [Paenibacillus sp. MMO-58]|uniref:glycosyl hydrolase family 28-related protein n=1 Tax=Paenibacillus sp. MMO-58 TaxID=3081290 RepID=UPI0030164FA4